MFFMCIIFTIFQKTTMDNSFFIQCGYFQSFYNIVITIHRFVGKELLPVYDNDLHKRTRQLYDEAFNAE